MSTDRPEDSPKDEPLFSEETRRAIDGASEPVPKPTRSLPKFPDAPPERPALDPQAGSSGWATASLLFGLSSFLCTVLTAIPGIICGVISLSRTSAGKGKAIAGIVMSVVGGLVIMPTILILVGLLLPAVQKVRDAAARSKDMNNFRQVGIGMHGHVDADRNLPQADGNLSWRVAVLPFIEEGLLFDEFNKKNAWDDPENRRFAERLVKPYVSPSDPPGTVDTRTRVFTGPDTLFPPGRGVRFHEVTDGLSNTILFVQAAEMVRWPQPKELPYSKSLPLPPFSKLYRNSFMVAMGDGSVRMVKDDIDPATIRAAITRDGDERVNLPEP